MYKDSHVHTEASHDGKSGMADYVREAESKGVDEITFTEHFDIYDGLKTNLKTLDVSKYFWDYNDFKRNSKFKVNFGIEIGLQPDIVQKVNDIAGTYPFDFIIGSSHITCKKDMAMDRSFFEGITRHEAYMRYFEEVLENIKVHDNFDVYGHLDYVVRYGGYTSKVIEYEEFKDILDEILTGLIRKDKGIEINTSGLRYGLPSFHPNKDIVKRYIELGGKIITVGSDAHKSEDLAKDFNVAYDLLRSLRVYEIAVFHKRQPSFVSII